MHAAVFMLAQQLMLLCYNQGDTQNPIQYSNKCEMLEIVRRGGFEAKVGNLSA